MHKCTAPAKHGVCLLLFLCLDNMQNQAGRQGTRLDSDVITASHLDSERNCTFVQRAGFCKVASNYVDHPLLALQYVSLVFAEPSHNTLASPATINIISVPGGGRSLRHRASSRSTTTGRHYFCRVQARFGQLHEARCFEGMLETPLKLC
jgi:hypothetical protein